jgi:hypothetical protein
MAACREFLTIFRKARAGELELESGLGQLASLTEVDVDEVGVGGAKNFFEAKVKLKGSLPFDMSIKAIKLHCEKFVNLLRMRL